jgi:hypothetical protein
METDSHRIYRCGDSLLARTEFTGFKSEIGEGGSDGIAQAEQCYVRVYSSNEVCSSGQLWRCCCSSLTDFSRLSAFGISLAALLFS